MSSSSRLALACVLACATLAACGGGSSGTPSGNAFVASQIAGNTNDTAEPVQINDSDLQFSENPAAFDALFD